MTTIRRPSNNFCSFTNSIAIVDEKEDAEFKKALAEFVRDQKEKMESVK